MHKLGRGGDDLVGPDRPIAVVHIKLWHHIGEIEIGIEIGIERADIAPVIAGSLGSADAAVGKPVRHGFAMFHDIGNDILAKIAA